MKSVTRMCLLSKMAFSAQAKVEGSKMSVDANETRIDGEKNELCES
jgi:hypothetical protein